MNVIPFPDQALSDAQQRFDRLIERARASVVFGSAVDFATPVWDLAPVKPARPSAGSAKQAKLYFTTHDAGTAKGLDGRTLLEPKFAAFVKALIVLREESRQRSAKDHGKLLRAARCLYDAMGDATHDPVQLRSTDFQAACDGIKTRTTQRGKVTAKTTAYRLGQGLAEIATAINRYDVCKVRISFSNPFPRVAYDHTRVSEEARAERATKMASEETVGAIIDTSLIVRQRQDDHEKLLMSVVELLTCAPARINEVLYMRADCRRTDQKNRKGTEELVQYLGYAYDGSKRAPDSTRWIPTAMVDIADRALADIKRITQPFRDIALWMERNPGRAYVAEPWRLADPETLLGLGDVTKAVGLAAMSVAVGWMKTNGIKRRVDRKKKCYRLGDIEAAILRAQPTLPDPKLKLSEFMFLVPLHYFRPRSGTQEHTLTFVSDQNISDFLCGRGVTKSVFERLDIRDQEGKPYRVPSHSLRHFLNTLAQEGLLSQLDIARWSGRKDVRENAAYDHTGGRHLAGKLRKMAQTEEMAGPVVETAHSLPPVEREDFLKARFKAAHTTELGMCVSDWSMAPCASHGACAGCQDHLIVKGDAKQKAAAERLLAEHEFMLDQARQVADDGNIGASNWAAHTEKMVDGLKKTIAVHDNPEIPDGTLAQA